MATIKALPRLIKGVEALGMSITGTRHYPSARCESTGIHYACGYAVDAVDPKSGYSKVYHDVPEEV